MQEDWMAWVTFDNWQTLDLWPLLRLAIRRCSSFSFDILKIFSDLWVWMQSGQRTMYQCQLPL